MPGVVGGGAVPVLSGAEVFVPVVGFETVTGFVGGFFLVSGGGGGWSFSHSACERMRRPTDWQISVGTSWPLT